MNIGRPEFSITAFDIIRRQVISPYQEQLDALQAESRLRTLIPRQGIDFTSNDYLGLANSPILRDAVRQGIEQGIPMGSGGSRLLRGNHEQHELLETEAAAHFGSESALYLSTGFAANTALFATLPQRGDIIVHDALVHASIHDGMKLSRADSIAALHNDPNSFDDIIRDWRDKGGTGRPWIAVESVYSMDGDIAPLHDLITIADRHDAMLVIDEAHATGVFGPQGRGLAHDIAGRPNVITLHTCGKALGSEGALLCAPRLLISFLINRARPFIFSTAPSPLMAWQIRQVLQISAQGDDLRSQLGTIVHHVHERLYNEFDIKKSQSQIIPIIIGENDRTMRAANALQMAGFDVRGIRPPTVAAGTARLRISVTNNIDTSDADALLDAMTQIL